jgi:23S rRNA (uracil1939-C5)-methyltransferase
MIARADDGRVVLVAGAIPGERVSAAIERVGKGVVFARTTAVLDPSPDRSEPGPDPTCGGRSYAHIAYARQLAIKSQVIADGFQRIGRISAPPVAVAGSPDAGYRMRAKLHVRGRRIGFFREGTHDVCDARATGQLLPATCDALERLAAGLGSLGIAGPAELDLSENVDASERAVHLTATADSATPPLAALGATPGLTGLSTVGRAGPVALGGSPYVVDRIRMNGDSGPTLALRRHVLAFFQGNRFLLEPLVSHVSRFVDPGSRVVDLYAGAGLFSLAAAARGARVVGVEGDRVAAADLAVNAQALGGSLEAVHQPVEVFLASRPVPPLPDMVIVDPPRTGMSREAIEGAIAVGPPRMLYVSCDVATLARDARRLVDAGYRIGRADAFDLFPITPHVETVVEFVR